MKSKLWFPLILFVVVLHYLAVFGMSSRIPGVTASFLVAFTLMGALCVWMLSGWGDER